MQLSKINLSEKLYVMNSGDGYSCYGFDVLDKKARAVAQWMGEAFIEQPLGTGEHFAACRRILSLGADYAKKTGTRCNYELVPGLIGLEHKRVECDYFGERIRFYVGKSTGWMPCHIQLKTRSSSDGEGLLADQVKNIRTVGGSL